MGSQSFLHQKTTKDVPRVLIGTVDCLIGVVVVDRVESSG